VLFHRQLINLKFQERSSRRYQLRAEVDLWRDDADFQESGDRFRARLREGYVKISFRDADLRIGRMQIAWGEADGVIVSDQVSPFDLENFIVPPFDEIRLGVDAVKLDYYFEGGSILELAWISHFTSPDFPEDGSPWTFVDDTDLAAFGPIALTLTDVKKPAKTFANSEVALRLRGFGTKADWQIGYLWAWDDRPALRVRLSDGLVEPTHERFHLVVAGLTAPLGPVLITGDTALEIDRRLSILPGPNDDPAAFVAAEFVSKENVWRSVVAVDFKPEVPGWEQANATLQLVHERVLAPSAPLAEDQKTYLASARLTAAYLNETIKPSILAIASLEGDSTWVQAKCDWEPIDNWRLTMEYDLFDGHTFDGSNGGIFGRFANNDVVFARVRYSF
ncbi:MAG: DUF1302 family protein, partial [Candidatus Binatia bacterium]